MKRLPTARRTTRTGVVALTATGLLTAGLAATSAPAYATDPSGCSTGQVPAVAQGAPDLKAGQSVGVYLWHGSSGWGVRATHGSHDRLLFTGRISVSNQISNVRFVHLEKGDSIKLSGDKKQLTFAFHNVGGIDGFNFEAGCSKRMVVGVRIGDQSRYASPARVKLGKDRTSPTSNPFTLERFTQK